MQFNSRNIEEWMFDFHEGMLSESEKTAFLNFLHKHPEYNSELGLWAQTHGLKKEKVPLPADLLTGVIKPLYVPFYLKKIFIISLTVVVLSGLTTILYLPKKIESNSSIVQNIIINKTGSSVRGHDDFLKEKNKKQTHTLKKTLTQKPEIQEVKDTVTIEAKNVSVLEPEMKSSSADSIFTVPEIISVTVKDSSHTNVVENKDGKTEIKKRKKGLPLNIKPQSNFKPANPNF